MATLSVESVISDAVSKLSKPLTLKLEQELAVKSLLAGRDVLAVLPTGFGKSLVFQVFVKVKSLEPSTDCGLVLVVCPLKGLIRDQIEEANSLGLNAFELESPDVFERVSSSDADGVQIVFASAEAVGTQEFLAKLKHLNVHLVVIDESHTIETWTGERNKKEKAFRSAYGELALLRSFCKQGTPYLALTGTADKNTQSTIIKSLSMVNPERIVISPERKNLRITVVKCKKSDMFTNLDWIVDMIRDQGKNMPKTIIFCNMMSEMAAVANYLLLKVGRHGYQEKECMIDIFHSMSWTESKEQFLKSFKRPDSVKRVVVSSTALSMGVNFPDVKFVINWGPARTLLEYHQEAGRAGRNGNQAYSVVIYHGNQTAHCDADVKNFVRTSDCYRVASLKPFVDNVKPLQPGHNCCSNCALNCKCGTSCSLLPFECKQLSNVHVPLKKSRNVSRQQSQDLEEALDELHKKFATHCSLEAHGFSDSLVKELVRGANNVFSIKDVLQFPVFSVTIAAQIIEIFQDIFDDIQEIENVHDFFPDNQSEEVAFPPAVFDEEDQAGEHFDDDELEEGTW